MDRGGFEVVDSFFENFNLGLGESGIDPFKKIRHLVDELFG